MSEEREEIRKETRSVYIQKDTPDNSDICAFPLTHKVITSPGHSKVQDEYADNGECVELQEDKERKKTRQMDGNTHDSRQQYTCIRLTLTHCLVMLSLVQSGLMLCHALSRIWSSAHSSTTSMVASFA